jgi:hypothetical protein
MYTYFVNDDVKPGKELASVKVEVRNGSSPVTYDVMPKEKLQVLKIDSQTGKITLGKDLRKFLRLRRDGTRRLFFKVTACKRSGKRKHCATANVRIIALQRKFGDKFVEEALKHVNVIFKGVTAKTITPSLLLRVFRRVPKSSEEIAMIDAKQELLLDYVKRKILSVLSLNGK